MFKSRSDFARLFLLGMGLLSCAAPEHGGGQRRELLNLENFPLPVETEAGIYPNQMILTDPQNPFTRGTRATDLRWVLTGWSLENTTTRSATLYYIWATELAQKPSGEAQYYVGLALRNMGQITSLEATERSGYVSAAIRAFQVVLDTFPDSVTYRGDAATPLAPLAAEEIDNLKATQTQLGT